MPGANSSNPAARARSLANLIPGAKTAPPGNERRKTHGAYAQVSPARLDEKLAEIAAALGADLPLKEDGQAPAADTVTVELLARALVRLGDVSDWLTRRGIEDEKGRVRETVLDLERRLRSEAADHADRLGLNPRARVALGLDLAKVRDELGDYLRSSGGG